MSHRLEIWIARVLRIGVGVASGVILVGLLLSGLPTGPQGIPFLRADPVSIVRLGLLLLILTPVVRVAMTVALFASEREWTFVAVTASVLFLLILGLAGIG